VNSQYNKCSAHQVQIFDILYIELRKLIAAYVSAGNTVHRPDRDLA
jgi:hypothetical protein